MVNIADRAGSGVMGRRGVSRALVVLLLGALLAACAGGEDNRQGGTSAPSAPAAAGSEDAESAGDLVPVSFAASAGSSSIGLLAGLIKDRGIDRAHGIDLQISEFAPDAAEQALLTGQVDTSFFAPVSWAKVREEGRDIVFLRPIQQAHTAVVVRDDSPYQSLQDLQGERVATLNPVSGVYTSMQVLAAEVGLSWEGDFEVISAPPPGLVAFIEGGDAEAIVHFEPTVSSLLADGGYRIVMTPSERWEELTGAPLFMLGLATTREWMEANPQAARNLSAVIQQAVETLHDDPSVIADYQEPLGLSDEALEIAQERMSDIYIPEDPADIEDNVHHLLERAHELGIIGEIPEPIFEEP
ncbi:MAG: PhnD/SsuA/transferrin family substrate-binding protein [Nitriliruptorales bacterium]|nr:PhnD/SsuA/transferrin family substrate-binding protein [Nitriliruptorales bacterium]